MPYRIRFVITLLTAVGWCGAQSSSFLFNMQPARITATIGTGGRNIRHLPCVSRKSGAEGVCMFAIDCLKANGTHLGTCIDRFYFGSCCSVQHSGDSELHESIVPVPGLLDNTIDGSGSVPVVPPSGTGVINDLIPILKPAPGLRPDYSPISTTSRSPESNPTTTERFITTQKVDTTSKPASTTARTTTTTSTSKPVSTTHKVVTTVRPTQANKKPVVTTTTTSKPKFSTRRPNPATIKPISGPVKTNGTNTRIPPAVTTKSPPLKTTQKYKPTTQLLNENEIVKVTTTTKPTNAGLSTENPYKISTFQSVINDNKTKTSTVKPLNDPKPTQRPTITNSSVSSKPKPKPPVVTPTQQTRPKPTQKPRPNVTKKPTRRPTLTTKPAKTTPRPVQPVRNTTTSSQRPPIRTTAKPVEISSTTTQSTIKTTQKPVVTTTSPLVTTQFVKTTKKPVQNTTEPVTTTEKPIRVTTTTSVHTSKPVTQGLPVLIPISSPKPVVSSTVTTTTKRPTSTEQFMTSSSVESGHGPVESVATNEVLPPDETKPPGLVTWTSILEGPTTPPVTNTTHPTTDEWTPITTPDDWVLLPSVSSTNISTQPNTTSRPTVQSTSDHPTTTSSRKPPPMVFPTEKPSRPSLPPANSTPMLFPESTIPPAVTVKLPDVATQTIPVMFPDTTSYRPPIMIAGLSPIPADMTSSVSSIDVMSTTESSAPNLENAETNGTSPAIDQIEDFSATPPVNMSDYTQVCGRRLYPQARIVGGESSTFGKWPWQISLRQWRTSTYLHKCGAALLNENWAITAAHCVDNVTPSDLLLRLGEHDLSSEAEPYGFQERRVQIIASHPQFDPRTFEYDLALLRFYEPVTFQPNIIPVCVPDSDERFVGRMAYVTGWGRLYEDGPLPNVLQQVTVPVINNTVCEYMYRSAGYIEHIPEIFICAGWRRGGFDSCEGDSGGPMVIQRPDKRFILAGVISWGIGCAEPNQPGVYTRISEFRHWINQILQF